MLIECPHCAKTYHITRDSVGEDGRSLRCAACREVWRVAAGAPHDGLEDMRLRHVEMPVEDGYSPGIEIRAIATSARAAPPTYEELYGDALVLRAKPPRAPWKLPRPPGALVAALLVLALGMGLVAERRPLVRFVPVSAGLYAAIGLPVNLRGLELRHVTSTLVGEGAQKVLAVEGEITNVSRAETSVPLLQVSLRGLGAREIYGWTTSAPKARLAQGETVQFRARLASPPDSARDVTVRFAPDSVLVKEARK